ncbi:uncharacterized protein LOC126934912 [Macaca thibetana thibetana]|uniref:uncharacterized protein LOC126934912 n=1 Tax=Macaca thibetana thibetana TaxID=257877 RepID=UPI0021BC7F7C|nr:uncharacterized protein LOC126934912 [Macaca thibetana thibetana]
MREREMGYQKLFGSGSGSTPGLRRHRSLCPFHAFFGLCRVCIPVSEVFVVVLSRTSFHSSLSLPTPLVSLPSYSRWRATGKLRRCWRRRRPGGCVEEAATAARRREGPGGGGGLSEGLEPRGLTSTRGHKRRTETSLVRATFHPPAPQSAQVGVTVPFHFSQVPCFSPSRVGGEQGSLIVVPSGGPRSGWGLFWQSGSLIGKLIQGSNQLKSSCRVISAFSQSGF